MSTENCPFLDKTILDAIRDVKNSEEGIWKTITCEGCGAVQVRARGLVEDKKDMVFISLEILERRKCLNSLKNPQNT